MFARLREGSLVLFLCSCVCVLVYWCVLFVYVMASSCLYFVVVLVCWFGHVYSGWYVYALMCLLVLCLRGGLLV